MISNNPVLQRELIVNLRTPRSFFLMLAYQVALAAVVLIAYPQDVRIDLSVESASAQRLVDFFFLGQFVLVSLMVPSFASGSISGEKERKTYEMLLASPLRPSRIVFGKMVASLTHLLVLIAASLPTIMLCLPLGGVSIYELLSAYSALIVSIVFFGAISVFCSSRFKRTSSSLLVSYLAILPMVIVFAFIWRGLAFDGNLRIIVTTVVYPIIALVVSWVLLAVTANRLLYPPDMGSQGNEVVDLDKEQDTAVGMVIQRDQFPDNLFAPPRRKKLMPDNANPVYDKELHSELFSQGTLMLRLVIQISMFLALPAMGVFLFLLPSRAGMYFAYAIVFNILTAPVFLAGAISSERERQTLDLLLTTLLTPKQILLGKAFAGYRVSAVLTGFVMFPVLLGFLLNTELARQWDRMAVFCLIVFVVSLFNSCLALFCSVAFRRTATAMMACYVSLFAIYFLPFAVTFLFESFARDVSVMETVRWVGIASPFAAINSVVLDSSFIEGNMNNQVQLPFLQACQFALIHIGMMLAMTMCLIGSMLVLFRQRWRITDRN